MKRTKLVPIRLTPEEYERINHKAQAANLDFSKYMRQAALGQRLPPVLSEIAIKTYAELGKVGNNLNQLTKAVNQAVKRGNSPKLDPVPLERLLTLLHQIRLEVAGVNSEEEAEP